MTCTDRVNLLRNTLTSWTGLTYPDYEFFLIDDASKDQKGISDIAIEFSDKICHFWFERLDNLEIINRIWNRVAKEQATGDFIVFAMADEIISSKDIIQKMLECPKETRCSVMTYFLSETMTNMLGEVDWQNNPSVIESLPNFWDYAWDKEPNRVKAQQEAGHLAHITGWSREGWDWFGWFRNHETGYRWLDQDVRVRENALKITAQTVRGVTCYHQWHRAYGSNAGTVSQHPGYVYANERQARLLEEAQYE
jgi:glycosyltransferase involved in cell wall biosynthesis